MGAERIEVHRVARLGAKLRVRLRKGAGIDLGNQLPLRRNPLLPFAQPVLQADLLGRGGAFSGFYCLPAGLGHQEAVQSHAKGDNRQQNRRPKQNSTELHMPLRQLNSINFRCVGLSAPGVS